NGEVGTYEFLEPAENPVCAFLRLALAEFAERVEHLSHGQVLVPPHRLVFGEQLVPRSHDRRRRGLAVAAIRGGLLGEPVLLAEVLDVPVPVLLPPPGLPHLSTPLVDSAFVVHPH